MSKMSTDLTRHALNGATMGTRWSALFFAARGVDPAPVQTALQAAVDDVDQQMSTWNPDSALMRLNAAPVDSWWPVPAHLMTVLQLGLQIGKDSNGAFDIAMGDTVTAWGFGPADADPTAIRALLNQPRRPAHELLETDPTAGLVRKRAPLALDLNGIAKGYGTDRLAETLATFGITAALVGIDGEMRALGLRPDGSPWTIAVEAPDHDRRRPQSILSLTDAAVATSGDYRHWVTVQGRRLSHTMDPARSAPLLSSPASVTVIAPTCAQADAWATALMVRGTKAGAEMARQNGLDALFLTRADDGTVNSMGIGPLFGHTNPGGNTPALAPTGLTP
ncbi:MAG: FAD:protein FMN transferase [Alphaproteobacteria bacterium]|nr:FAD:protein FMN transferase [Alphaproteobacteria bacterium]